jgi:hypothetical protein
MRGVRIPRGSPDEVSHLRRNRGAMNSPNNMKPEARIACEETLLSEIKTFLDQLEQDGPAWDDGEANVIEFSGARVGYDDDDNPLYSFNVKTTRCHSV